MQSTPLFLLLLLSSSTLASVSLASVTPPTSSTAGKWWCDLAKDGAGFPQQPYCCDDSRVEQWPNGMITADSCGENPT